MTVTRTILVASPRPNRVPSPVELSGRVEATRARAHRARWGVRREVAAPPQPRGGDRSATPTAGSCARLRAGSSDAWRPLSTWTTWWRGNARPPRCARQVRPEWHERRRSRATRASGSAEPSSIICVRSTGRSCSVREKQAAVERTAHTLGDHARPACPEEDEPHAGSASLSPTIAVSAHADRAL